MFNRRDLLKRVSCLPFCGFLTNEIVKEEKGKKTIDKFIENKLNWYPYQRQMLKMFANTDKNIIFKCFKNGGFTTMAANYAAYEAAVNGKKVIIFSRFGLSNLFFTLGHHKQYKWEFESGGFITVSNYENFQGFIDLGLYDICICDNFADGLFIQTNGKSIDDVINSKEIVKLIYSIKLKVILYSNVGWHQNFANIAFELMYNDARTRKNTFFDFIEVSYLDYPIHGIDKLRKSIGEEAWRRDYMCDFNWENKNV